MDLTTRRSFLASLIKLTTDTLTVLVNVLLIRLKQVRTRPAKTELVKGLKKRGSVKSEIVFKGSKVRQVSNRTVQFFFGFVF
jgi:hypothetical protein